MSNNHEIAELIWENGHLSMHELGMILPTAQRKATWNGNGDTLESIVKQATSHSQNINIGETNHHQNRLGSTSSIVESYNLKCAEHLKHLDMILGFTNKRMRSEHSDQDLASRSARASASTTFCGDDETTLITWPFIESPPSLKTKSMAVDSACHDESETPDKEHETKREAVRSHTRRRSRDSDVHNQSERRRRDRINQKMKALQELVPNANKTDKTSVLDEVISYLKQLQAQVQMMRVRNTPQMMMPLAMQQQQQLQMNLLARMGMGVGPGMSMGMLDMTNLQRTAAAPNFIPPPFLIPPMLVPPMFQSHIPSQSIPNQGATNTSAPFNDPYCAFLAQSRNMELYNKMAAATTAAQYQEVTHAAKGKGSNSKFSHVQGE